MNTFKKITLILMILILTCSAIFNILIFSSSFGTLVLKHNDEKLIAMTSAQRLELEPSYFLVKKNNGIQIFEEIQNPDSSKTNEYYIYVDENRNVTVCIKDASTNITTYFEGGKTYNGEGKETLMGSELAAGSSILTKLNVLQDALIADIETSNNKAKMDFSFDPFYFLGIKYSIEEEHRTTTYKYDLSGNLQKIIIEEKDTTTIYSISFDKTVITIPSLEK